MTGDTSGTRGMPMRALRAKGCVGRRRRSHPMAPQDVHDTCSCRQRRADPGQQRNQAAQEVAGTVTEMVVAKAVDKAMAEAEVAEKAEAAAAVAVERAEVDTAAVARAEVVERVEAVVVVMAAVVMMAAAAEREEEAAAEMAVATGWCAA